MNSFFSSASFCRELKTSLSASYHSGDNQVKETAEVSARGIRKMRAGAFFSKKGN